MDGGFLFRICQEHAWLTVWRKLRANLVAVFVLSLIGSWNEYIVALTLAFRDLITIPPFMGMQTSQTGYTEWWNMSAISLVSVIPVVTAGMATSPAA